MKKLILALTVVLVVVVTVSFFFFRDRSVTFASLVQGEVVEFAQQNLGNGVTYRTRDKELIARYLTMLNSTTYSPVKVVPAIGASAMNMYDSSGKLVGSVTFLVNQTVIINQKAYKMNTNVDAQLKTFNQVFFSDIHDPAYTGKEIPFRDLLKGEVGKIQTQSNEGTRVYQTSDANLIQEFLSAMESTTYMQTSPRPITVGGSRPLDLYDKKGNKIGSIEFKDKGYVQIFSQTYRMKKDVNLDAFLSRLRVAENVVK